MSNKSIFQSNPGNILDSNAVNEAGGKAYALSDKAALAQYALTGTFHGTFYASDEDQLKRVLELANKCDPEYVAKLAVFAREQGLMKDSPAVLAAVLAKKNVSLLKKIFPFVISDMKMLRNFVQVIRSNAVGRKSFGTAVKKLINGYLSSMSDEHLFKSDIGTPSTKDILCMTHPKPANDARSALYGYLLGKNFDGEKILPLVNEFEAFKKDVSREMPNIPFQMLTSMELTKDHWKLLAKRATWNQIRQNLNAFARHNVFDDKDIVKLLANRLQDANEVNRARVFPYQLFTTFLHLEDNIPTEIKIAIQNACEIAIENVPVIEGNVIVALDVSGSMKDPITGKRGTASSKMKCIDVASLFAAAIVRKNPLAKVVPFDTAIKKVDFNSLDTITTNAKKFADAGMNGGTDCAIPIKFLNETNQKADMIVMISDNQSWVQSAVTKKDETPMMREWSKFMEHNKGCKLVCVDIAPYGASQVYDTRSTMNVGGFGDSVFTVINSFVKNNDNDLVSNIEKVVLAD